LRATNVRTGPAWRASAREQQRHARALRDGPRKFYVGPLLILLFLGIEALLGARIVGQATSQSADVWPFSFVFWLTDFLVQPFRDIRPEPALKETGIVEFATLIAFEAYLVAFLVLIFLIQVVHISAWFVRRARRRAQASLATVEPVAVSTPQTETQQAA
jgi:hypothetical protein